jgi:hypothetical protein
VHLDDGVELVDAHLVEEAVAQDAGVVDHHVDAAEVSSAHCTMRAALAASLTLSVLATASPPSALISFTTCCAGPASLPSPP